MEAKMYYYLGILCLVASTFALPMNSDNFNSSSYKERKEIKEDYKNNVEVKKDKSRFPESIHSPSRYEWKEDNYAWIDDFSEDYKEIEDEQVQKEEAELEKAADEKLQKEEAKVEKAEAVDVGEEEYSDEDEDDKYSNIEKSVSIKWKIPRSVLLRTLNAYFPPVPRNKFPYVYQPYHFPITLNNLKAPYSRYGNN